MRSVRSALAVLAPALLLVSFLSSSAISSSASTSVPSPPEPSSQSSSSPATPPAAAQAQDKNVADFEQRLKRIDGQIQDIKARIEAEARKESSVLSSLARINLNKSLVERELAAQNIELERARADLAAAQAGVRARRADVDRERASIAKTLVALYKFGRVDFFQFLLQARDIESYAAESKHLTLLARHQENVLEAFLRSLEELRAAESALESKERDLAELVRAASLKKQELDSEARKSAALVRDIRRNRETFKQALDELAASAGELQKLMDKILSQEWVLPETYVPLNERRGRLPWPLEGKVITAYGLERHPEFQTTVLNKGIEISPRRDRSLILAVHTGKVVYADYFAGYGNVLIIDHGLTYYSLYGHCAEFLAAVGDMVKAGQPVAVVGDTGSLKGECLYFEIRQKTRALDPLQWLRRR